MERRITHACGHEQDHYLNGFPGQQDRKARWLMTTTCRSCFAAAKKSEQVDAATHDAEALADLDLPDLVGSDRQVSWASTIRNKRLAAMLQVAHSDHETCHLVTDAKWWIDHRDLADADLLARAALILTMPHEAMRHCSAETMPSTGAGARSRMNAIAPATQLIG